MKARIIIPLALTALAAGTDLKVRCVGLVSNCVTTCALRGWTEQ